MMTLLLVSGGWTDSAVPYTIDQATFASTELAIINLAISRWNTDVNSPTLLVPRTSEDDYLNFRRHQTACDSQIGRVGGRQEVLCAVGLQAGFQFGNVMHEIGHVMGLYHEHQRADRNKFVTVATGADSDFAILQGGNVAAFGTYDLGSIMHYSPSAQLSVDVAAPPGTTVGQRQSLSAGDRLGLTWLRRDFFRETGALRQISVSSDGAVWGVNSGGDIYTRAVVDRSFTQVRGALVNISCAAGSQVWGVNASGSIFSRNNTGEGSWDPISGSLRIVSVADDGSVWGVNRQDEIFQRSGNTWIPIPGRLRQISVASNSTVWGVNSNEDIFTWNGTAWDQVAGSLRWVSAASDGTVWGVNRHNEIFVRNMTSTWSRVSGSLEQVSVGSFDDVMGVNRQGRIYSFRM